MHTLRECILCGRVVVFQADYIVILISHSKLRFIVFAWLRCSKQDMEQLPVSKLTTEDDSVIRVFHHSVSFGHVSVSFHLCQCSFSLSLSAAALSVLRSSEEQTPIPQNKFMGDIEELAASYERKLIEVSVVLIHTATERRISVKCF